VRLSRDPLSEVANYFDDIIITNGLEPTYQQTVQKHFEILEKAVERLAFHGLKINVMKCDFVKSKINFLGWIVSHSHILTDPRRIKKVKEFSFPNSKKQMHGFLGLTNSLRRVLPMDIIEEVGVLTPLTSSKLPFNPDHRHIEAFEKIKLLLTQEPLFSHLIDEKAPKFLWVDASTTGGTLGAVLAQQIGGEKSQGDILPTELSLDDPVHRVIYDNKLQFTPITLYTSLPIELPKPSLRKAVPPNINEPETLLVFTPENVVNSFFWCVLSIMAHLGCKLPESTKELRIMALKKLKGGILNNKLKILCLN
jgi:hypothetical protein